MAILIQACYFVRFSNFVRLRAPSVRFLYRSHASCATKVLKSLNPIFFMNENQFVCIGVQQLLSVLHLTGISQNLAWGKKYVARMNPATVLYCTVLYCTVIDYTVLSIQCNSYVFKYTLLFKI